MFVTFTCPQCRKLVAVLHSSIGRREACPNCRAELFIPQATRRTAVPQTQMEGHAVQAQGGGPPLVELPSDEWEFGDIGFYANEHSYAYFVLTRDFFGWFPSIMPMNVRFSYPRKYYVIPIESITFAEIRPGGMHPSWRLFLHLEPESGEHVVEVGIGLPGRWRRALRTCKVPVIESGAYRVDSLRGWLNTYGLFALVSLEIIGFQAAFLWLLLTNNQPRNVLVFHEVGIICLGVVNAVLYGVVYLFKRRRSNSPNQDPSADEGE